jgi:hypothetical protein
MKGSARCLLLWLDSEYEGLKPSKILAAFWSDQGPAQPQYASHQSSHRLICITHSAKEITRFLYSAPEA